MPGVDMPPEQLVAYAPEPYREDDFDSFWAATLAELAEADPAPRSVPVNLPLPGLQAEEIAFTGLHGGEVTGWRLRPAVSSPGPALLVCHGYGGRAPRPLELVPYAVAGFTVLSVDCRGQMGQSGPVPGRGYVPGWMTQGLGDQWHYYYRYVYADIVRALDVLVATPGVDSSRVAVTGVSQGGGLSLVAAALSDVPSLVWSDIPFLCDFRRSVAIVDTRPYSEISDLLRARPELGGAALRSLSYFDVLNLAYRVKCKTFVTVGLWDDICPPSSIYGAFRQISSAQKELITLPFHRHEVDYNIAERRLQAITELSQAPRGGE